MAKKQNTPQQQSTSNIDTDIFVKGMTKDPNISLVGKDQWTHARNAINNSADGDVGTLGNEQANYLCDAAPYTIIGAIHLYADKWVLFSTNNEQSEIGTWDDSECKYKTVVNDYSCYECIDTEDNPFTPCLNFKTQNLITGASKENFDCSWQVYWDDGLNPSRTLNLDYIPYKQTIISEDDEDCVITENSHPICLDCEKLRLAPLVETPCIEISRSPDGGMLRNGTYQVFIAYVINDQTVGDYYGISNVQPLFEHEDTISGLDIKISNLDKGFEYFKLVICSNNQMEMQAKEVGIYSTQQEFISIDYINQKLKTVPIEVLPLRNPAYEKSDNMYVVNDYLIRQGPTEQFDFNYQPLANKIHVHWTSWQFPADYYKKGGSKPTFMRDEVYAFFIRFIYNTGEKSSSFHIPGKAPENFSLPDGTVVNDLDPLPGDPSEIASTIDGAPDPERAFEVYNTTNLWWDTGPGSNSAEPDTDDGGIKTAEGHMAYWESSEKYPNDPVRYGDLCSKPIRHHKFPDETVLASDNGGTLAGQNGPLDRSSNDNTSINILGARFYNIEWPRFNGQSDPDNECDPLDPSPTGAIIPNIVGYEILVGSREGNKSIIAKGISRNMRNYAIPTGGDGHEGPTGQIGAIPNYPFNDTGADPYLSSNNDFTWTNGTGNIQNNNQYPAGTFGAGGGSYQDIFTFHSPETSFNRPYLNPYEIKTYGVTTGTSLGRFKKSEKHPQQKLLRNISMWVAIFVGIGYAIAEMRGKKKKGYSGPKALSIGYTGTGEPIGGGSFTSGNLTSGGGGAWSPAAGASSNFANLSPSNQTANSGGDWEAGAPASTLLAPGNIYTNLGTAAGVQQVASIEGTAGLTGEPALGATETTATVLGGPKLLHQAAYAPGMMGLYGSATTGTWNRGFVGGGSTVEYQGGRFESLPSLLQIVYGAFEFMQFTATGGQEIIDLIYNLVSYQDYAWKYNAHGLYFATQRLTPGTRTRTKVEVARYIGSTMQQLTANIKINNIQRPATVAIKTDGTNAIPIPTPGLDQSKFIIGQVNGGAGIHYRPSQLITSSIAAHYTALKVKFANQYGQLDQINQIPVRGCVELWRDQPVIDKDTGEIIPFDNLNVLDTNNRGIFKSKTSFGGDCYLNRYTEKVIMPFFWDFLEGQPDGFPYDYRLRSNVPRPIYWMNSQKYDLSELVRTIMTIPFDFSTGALPSGLFVLDRPGADAGNDQAVSGGGGTQGGFPTNTAGPSTGDSTNNPTGRSLFHVKNGFMYTHNSGVNDFFVESEINTALRDWEDVDDKRHYDWMEYTDINELFDASIIKKGNFYKYDPSLSKNRFFSQLISFGLIQPRDYDPIVSANCYMHYPKRLIYSLQAQKEAKKDFWRVFLPNNYKDFKNKVNVIKPVSKSGAVVLFPNLAPALFQGIDQLQTDLGTKLTIGDGGLFGQPMQNIVNADEAHEYGSCESQRSVVNTPSGLFYISQAQGKVFHYTGKGLDNIANKGMKQWFNKYLPSNLLSHYPNMEDCQGWIDNPVAGVGCQTIYDPNFDIVYFCKKDYEPIVPECIDFVPCQGFVYNNTTCNGYEPQVCCPPDTTFPDGTIQTWTYSPPGITCPPGYTNVSCTDGSPCCTDNSGNPPIPATVSEGECIGTTYTEALNDTNQTLGDVDIAITVDSSNSVDNNQNVDNMQNFILDFISGISSELSTGQAQLSLVHFGSGRNTNNDLAFGGNLNPTPTSDTMFEPGEQIKLTSNSASLQNWVNTVYANACTNADSPEGTSIIGGIWCALNLLYGSGSRPVPKKLITIIDGPQSTAAGATLPTTLNSPQDVYDGMVVSPITPNVSIGINNDRTNNPGNFGWQGTPSGIDNWFQNNVINNPNYADLESFAVLVNPWNNDPNTYTPANVAASWRNYTDDLAHPGNGYYGSFNTPGSTDVITDGIISSITPPPVITWYCADSTCDLEFFPNTGDYMCRCTETIPATLNDSVTPINITDTEYFKDVSWTISYDPKSAAWISFHDWHPDLAIPSLNHFFTTKNYLSDSHVRPDCPPGYTWNATTMTCCQTFQRDFLADVIVEEAPVEVEITPIPCKLDIVIGIDSSGSTSNFFGSFRGFVDDFVAEFETEMNLGNTQIGLVDWATTQINCTPDMAGVSLGGGVAPINFIPPSMSNYTGSTDWGTDFLAFQNAGTAFYGGFDFGQRQLSDVLASILGDRTDQVGYKRIYIHMGDGANNPNLANIVPNAIGSGAYYAALQGDMPVGFPQSNLGIGYANAAVGAGLVTIPSETWGLFCHPTITAPAGQFNIITDNDTSKQNLSLTPVSVGAFASTLANSLCTLPPVCSCPAGYERVSSLGTGTAPPYQILGPLDDCTDKDRSGICRKIKCECNFDNIASSIINPLTSQTGLCPDIALYSEPGFVGGDPINSDPDYISNPLTCYYEFECCLNNDNIFEKGGIWKHNDRCDLYANYYDKDHPWEVEWVESIGQTVNTIRSIEYQLESYIYNGNLDYDCGDRFHDLDWNFDEAIIHNSEQVSGLLRLTLDPKNNAPLITQYPIITGNDIEILYSKVEQKYRFNQFWDITNDRGEFNTNANLSIFITQLNGYIRDLNQANLNYFKPAFQRKKFRHYVNSVILRKNISSNRKMLLKLANTKINMSMR